MAVNVASDWPRRDGDGVVTRQGTWEISWQPAERKLGKRHRSAKDWKRGRTDYVDVVEALTRRYLETAA
jgi:hypothetical protein